ncbi:MAG TPA: hypothetical protein VL242_23055, partial [Sorangium sp.]|nr:hypothetical protein [Sorangium sp.]
EKRRSKRANRWFAIATVIALIVFVVVLAVIQGDRIQGLSIASNFTKDPVIAELFGEQFALGLSVTTYYPIHGFIGLSQQLSLPFVFSGGASMPALASYKVQYLGGVDPMLLSYPARNEAITGWSSGQVWSTIFPWIASDLTFPGTVLAFTVFGWFLARFWLAARRELDPLGLAIFGMMMMTVFYIPANNQVMLSRYTAIGFITLLVVYFLRSLLRPPSNRDEGFAL